MLLVSLNPKNYSKVNIMSKHKHGDGGKLSARRDSANSDYIDTIRWELIKSTTPPERKEEIKRELEEIKHEQKWININLLYIQR